MTRSELETWLNYLSTGEAIAIYRITNGAWQNGTPEADPGIQVCKGTLRCRLWHTLLIAPDNTGMGCFRVGMATGWNENGLCIRPLKESTALENP